MKQRVENIRHLLRAKALADLYFFSAFVMDYAWSPDRTRRYVVPYPHKPLCRALQSPSNRKLIQAARGFLKTTLASKCYPLWKATADPELAILLVSHAHENAANMLKDIRWHVENNELYRWLFPEVIPEFSKVKWSNDHAELRRESPRSESTFDSAGLTTRLTSRHYDIIIEDDTIYAKTDDLTGDEILPDYADINQAIGWHRLADSLLVDPHRGIRVVVGSRWAPKDLINHVETNEDRYEKFACYARDADGKSSYPERFGDEVLQGILETQGQTIFSMQYLGLPQDPSSQLFHAHQFEYFTDHNLPAEFRIIVTVDPAMAERKRSDDTGILACAYGVDHMVYVLEDWSGHFGPRITVRKLHELYKALRSKYGVAPDTIAVEKDMDKGVLARYAQDSSAAEDYQLPIRVAASRGRPKSARIGMLEPWITAGRIKFRQDQKKLIDQLTGFPNAQHDERPDCLAYTLDFLGSDAFDREKLRKKLRITTKLDEMLAAKEEGRYDEYIGRFAAPDLGLAMAEIN